jgi:hypothetical protein
MKNLCATLALLVLVNGWSVAVTEDSLRVYYVKGEPVEQITNDGITVMVSHFDEGKLNRIKIIVINNSPEAVNVVPSQILLHETSPKDEELKIKSEHDLQKMVDRRVFWGQMVTAIGAGLSRSQSTIVTRGTYGSSVTTVNTPDYLAQERWMAAGDQLARVGREAMQRVDDTYLKKTTVFPDSQFMGLLWFSRQKTLQSGMVSVTIGARNYEFPFPPPETAKAPTAPGIPTTATAVATVPIPGGAIDKESASVGSQPKGATLLGVVGATFEQGGVEIVDIDPDGGAALAGLKIGDVINSVDGKRIRSMPGLAAALESRQPGSIVRIGYMFRNPSFGLMQGADKFVPLNKQ